MTYFTPSTHYVLHCLLCKFTTTSYFIAAAIFNLDLSLLHSPWGNPSWLTLIRVRSICKKNQQVSVNLFHDMEEGTILWLLTVNIAVTGCFTCYSVLYPSVCLPLLSVCLSVCCQSVFHVCLCLSVCLSAHSPICQSSCWSKLLKRVWTIYVGHVLCTCLETLLKAIADNWL